METKAGSPRQRAWRQSTQFKELVAERMRRLNAARQHEPVCGAKTRAGDVCQLPRLENGRCRFHGGLTPRGDAWHKPRWPKRDNPSFERKLNRKLADLEKRRLKRAERVAAMSPERRAKHEAWHSKHPPTSMADREARRRQREQNAAFREMSKRVDQQSSRTPELDTVIERLEALLPEED